MIFARRALARNFSRHPRGSDPSALRLWRRRRRRRRSRRRRRHWRCRRRRRGRRWRRRRRRWRCRRRRRGWRCRRRGRRWRSRLRRRTRRRRSLRRRGFVALPIYHDQNHHDEKYNDRVPETPVLEEVHCNLPYRRRRNSCWKRCDRPLRRGDVIGSYGEVNDRIGRLFGDVQQRLQHHLNIGHGRQEGAPLASDRRQKNRRPDRLRRHRPDRRDQIDERVICGRLDQPTSVHIGSVSWRVSLNSFEVGKGGPCP